jgi:hypothetical protein
MTDREVVTLREYVDQRLTYERKMVEDAQRVTKDALDKQALDYERRLDSLNHNLRLILDERKAFYTRDQHDIFADGLATWQASVNQQLTTIATWGAAGMFVLLLIEFAIRLFWKG